MCLIMGVILSNKLVNRVHFIYLNLLVDFNNIRRYRWGSTYLETLCREMYLGSLVGV
uniref:Aminotransferase-like plant mobile domain-containing protein n=1 Tax=Cajanus cajan TaxID=3821 RepID=A0A151TDZ9_CAJCA|nr:hypothetical protein KK1_011507 [Cajanus cajan]KYP65280.1 hypothetical protein KK1_011512 [Cajanus cajan]